MKKQKPVLVITKTKRSNKLELQICGADSVKIDKNELKDMLVALDK